MNNFHNNSSFYWETFALKNQEELYYLIDNMIKDRIREVAPQIISDYLRENLTFDFNLHDALLQAIMKKI